MSFDGARLLKKRNDETLESFRNTELRDVREGSDNAAMGRGGTMELDDRPGRWVGTASQDGSQDIR